MYLSYVTEVQFTISAKTVSASDYIVSRRVTVTKGLPVAGHIAVWVRDKPGFGPNPDGRAAVLLLPSNFS